MSIRESGHHTCYAQLYLHPCKIRIPGKFSCTTAPTPLHDRHYRKLRNCSARSRLSRRQYVAGVLHVHHTLRLGRRYLRRNYWSCSTGAIRPYCSTCRSSCLQFPFINLFMYPCGEHVCVAVCCPCLCLDFTARSTGKANSWTMLRRCKEQKAYTMEAVFPEALKPLADADPEVYQLVQDEKKRQWYARSPIQQ